MCVEVIVCNVSVVFWDTVYSYILCKYGEDWFSRLTPEITRVETVTFGMIWQNLAYCTKYLRTCWTDVHQRFNVYRQIDDSYKTDIRFVIA